MPAFLSPERRDVVWGRSSQVERFHNSEPLFLIGAPLRVASGARAIVHFGNGKVEGKGRGCRFKSCRLHHIRINSNVADQTKP